jgi:hypothetical protein
MTAFMRASIASGCWALGGCATIISGTTQNIGVSSTPPGATVTAEPGGHRVVAPAKMTLRRKEAPYRLSFNLEGYQPYNVTISADTNGWIFGNLIIGGIIGIIVDSSTGASNKLSPGEVHANLVALGFEPPVAPPVDPPVEPQTSGDDTLYVFAPSGALLGVIELE